MFATFQLICDATWVVVIHVSYKSMKVYDARWIVIQALTGQWKRSVLHLSTFLSHTHTHSLRGHTDGQPLAGFMRSRELLFLWEAVKSTDGAVPGQNAGYIDKFKHMGPTCFGLKNVELCGNRLLYPLVCHIICAPKTHLLGITTCETTRKLWATQEHYAHVVCVGCDWHKTHFHEKYSFIWDTQNHHLRTQSARFNKMIQFFHHHRQKHINAIFSY